MKMQSRMSGMMLAGVAAFALCAFGGTSTWKSTATGGWSDPDSWEGGVPDSSSTVVVPDNVDLPVYDADVTYAGAVSNITLGTGSRIVFSADAENAPANDPIDPSTSGRVVDLTASFISSTER